MPCNIGYKSFSSIQIPEPEPQKFKANAEAPNIDADLLAKLGNEDPEFLEWVGDLDIKSLLEEALKRTLRKIVVINGAKLQVNSRGMLEVTGLYSNDKEKRLLSDLTSRASESWQFEILGIVAELLGYNVTITKNGSEFILEAEEEGKSHPCDYIKVVKKDGNATLTFEHFKSRSALQLETAKFLTLAHKLGVKIIIGESSVSEGDPFPGEERHTHGHGHHHGHDHNHDDKE